MLRLQVRQVRSGIGCVASQIGTLKGLGLGKLSRTCILEDTPAVRGMIAKVHHLVEVSPAPLSTKKASAKKASTKKAEGSSLEKSR